MRYSCKDYVIEFTFYSKLFVTVHQIIKHAKFSAALTTHMLHILLVCCQINPLKGLPNLVVIREFQIGLLLCKLIENVNPAYLYSISSDNINDHIN